MGAKHEPQGNISYQHYRKRIDFCILDALDPVLPRRGAVLELCAGDGSFAARLLERRPDVRRCVLAER